MVESCTACELEALSHEPLLDIFRGVLGEADWAALKAAAVARAAEGVPRLLPLAYAYSDGALGLEPTLRAKMQGLSSREFEGVLHPVFEEDEPTLVAVGGVLGAAAGFLQALTLFR